NFVGDLRGADDAEPERRCVGDAGAVPVGGGDVEFLRERADLMAGAVDDDDVNVQAAQHRDVEQQVAEIVVGHHRAIDGDDEHLVAKLRDVVQDAAQVSRFHVRRRTYTSRAARISTEDFSEKFFATSRGGCNFLV